MPTRREFVPGFDSHGPASRAVLTAAFDELSGV